MLLKINMIFSLLLLTSYAINSEEKKDFVSVSGIIGRSEVKRSGSEQWDILKIGSILYRNDIIRVSDGSRAVIKWPGGNEIVIKSNSQLQIDISSDASRHIVLNHATLFWGAVYFIINKTFTKSTEKYSTKIFTPTSIIGIRGTSFSVAVEKESGTSVTKVVNGAVTVTNIYSGKSIFLDAIRKSVVKSNVAGFNINLLTDLDIDSMKNDYGKKLIEVEMDKQIKYTRSVSNAINNRPEDKIVLSVYSDFKNEDWDVGNAFEEELLDQLRNRYNVDVVKFPGKNAIDSVNFIKADSLLSNYVAEIYVSNISVDKVAGISASADKYSEQSVATICVSIRLKDRAKNKLVYDKQLCDKSTGRNNTDNSWEVISKLKFDPTDKFFSESLLGKAFSQSVASIIEILTSVMKN